MFVFSFCHLRKSAPRSLDATELKRVLGTDWHQFYDRTGISFYYNFLTEESYRTPPQATQDEMAKAKEIELMFNKPEKALRTPREIRPPSGRAYFIIKIRTRNNLLFAPTVCDLVRCRSC